MTNNSKPFQTNTVVTITSMGHNNTKFDAYKYWEIVGELSWRGASRMDATDAGKWCMHAEPGMEYKINNGTILLRVKEKK